MTRPVASILISSFNRLPLLRRTLWAIAHRPPSVDFEVVVCDDGSTEDVLGELRLYSARFPWTFVRFDAAAFEEKTGLTKYFNNSSPTNNIAARHARGGLIFQQGNEVLPWGNVYDRLIADAPTAYPGPPFEGLRKYWMVMSTTYDVPKQHLEGLDQYGANLHQSTVSYCARWPLQSQSYRSDVTNYISLAPRALWEELHGYDERYYAGISAEDSDFVRRARKLPGFQQVVSQGLSLHQSHGGRTMFGHQDQSIITDERWDIGVKINHSVYHSWDGTHHNRQTWPWGEYGVGEVITNWKG